MSGMKQQGAESAEGEVKKVQHLAFELTDQTRDQWTVNGDYYLSGDKHDNNFSCLSVSPGCVRRLTVCQHW